MISWLRQIFIWTDIRKRISFTVWYLDILKSILVIAICMLETFFKMMWLHWSTVPAKFSSYHWNLICTEYSYHKHGRAYQRFPIYIRLIFKDFLNSWYHYKFVFKLSLRIFHQLHNRRWNYSAVGYTCVSKRLFVYHLKRSKALLARILFVMRQNLIFSLIVIIHVIFKSLGFETVISIKKLDTAPSPLLWLIFPIWFILDE